jgi:HAD superfamily hydrolase (TIGR01458 family)
MSAASGPLEVEGLLLDLDGVVHIRQMPALGSFAAIERLREAGMPFRFVTNTTRRSRRSIVADLKKMGLALMEDEVLTPANLVLEILRERRLAPLFVIHPDLREDFVGAPEGLDAVVIGDAGELFTYEALNRAFRALVHGAEFFALARNRNFRDSDGELSLDVGGFVAGLEYASGREAQVFGKPAPAFFHRAVEALGVPARVVMMVGDDAEAVVGGDMAAGLMIALVKTGKYRAGQEDALAVPPTLVAENLAAVVDRILT